MSPAEDPHALCPPLGILHPFVWLTAAHPAGSSYTSFGEAPPHELRLPCTPSALSYLRQTRLCMITCAGSTRLPHQTRTLRKDHLVLHEETEDGLLGGGRGGGAACISLEIKNSPGPESPPISAGLWRAEDNPQPIPLSGPPLCCSPILLSVRGGQHQAAPGAPVWSGECSRTHAQSSPRSLIFWNVFTFWFYMQPNP